MAKPTGIKRKPIFKLSALLSVFKMSAYLYLFLQSVSEGSQVPVQEHPSPSQTDQNLMRSDAKFSYEMSVNGKTLHRDYLDAHIQQGEEAQTMIFSATSETQVNDLHSLVISLRFV